MFGQLFSKALLEPAIEARRVRGQIAYALVLYADVYSNPGGNKAEPMVEASKELRRLASELLARTYSVPGYGFFEALRFLPKIADVEAASRDLIGLSNSVHHGDAQTNTERRIAIQKHLRLRGW